MSDYHPDSEDDVRTAQAPSRRVQTPRDPVLPGEGRAQGPRNQGPVEPAPHAEYDAPRQRKAKRPFRLKFSATEIGLFLLVLNLAVMAVLFIKVYQNKPPVIATVAVSQLARTYESQFVSDPTATPELIKLKTNIFMAQTEQAVQAMAVKQHMVVFARECVLSGETQDLTPQLQTVIDNALKQAKPEQAAGGDDAVSPFHVN